MMRRIFWYAMWLLVVLTAAFVLLLGDANAGDGDGIVYTDRYSRTVNRFTDGGLVCYVIFAQRDGDHTIMQCYDRER